MKTNSFFAISVAVAFAWPEPTREMKPWVYNWWMGSAVDRSGLEYQCRELADKGFDEHFSGTMLYRTTFNCEGAAVLSLGEVREIARVRLNGRDLGVKFMPPYDFPIPEGVMKTTGNLLEVEVTNLGANRLRWNDLNGIDWKYFSDINIVGIDYKKLDASKWKPLRSGLLGPVEIVHKQTRK